jgi:hypothetical protein
VRKAGTVRDGDRLGPWLDGVALRVARRARQRAARATSDSLLTLPAREPAEGVGDEWLTRLVDAAKAATAMADNLPPPAHNSPTSPV